MDDKDVKAGLKAARDAIRDKDFKSALKHCKGVLKIDKNNYNALVFVGVCAQELDQPEQAVLAFRKAIEISPDLQLAWQGLAAFYEKNPANNGREMIDIYLKAADFHNEPKRKIETLAKLSKVYLSEDMFEESVDALRKGIDVSIGNEEHELQAYTLTCEVLGRFPQFLTKHMNLYEISFKGILNSAADSVLKINIGKNYVAHLQKRKRYEDAKDVVENLQRIYPDDESCKDLLFNVYFESAFDGKYLDIENIENTCVNCIERSSFAKMALGAVKFRSKDFPSAKEHFLAGLDAVPSSIRGWLFLCRTLRKMYNWSQIHRVALQGLKMLASQVDTVDNSLEFQLRMYNLASLLENCSDFDNSALQYDLHSEVYDAKDINELLYFQASFFLKSGKVDKVQTVLDYLRKCDARQWVLGLESLMCSREGSLVASKEKLEEALKYDPENGILLCQLGNVVWACGEPEEAKDIFLQSVKIDQWNYEAFLMLGRYYRDVAKDVTRAQRCYLKAFNLNEKDEIGKSLSDLYSLADDQAGNLKLLLHVTKSSATGSRKWAWIRLGLCYLKQNDTALAIVAFQATLRADPFDGRCWECLADAYFQRGSFDAALKSFQRASEINSSSIYSMHQMANIRSMLGEYAEAVNCYKQVLEMSPSYLPALKGLAEAHLALARNHLSNCLFGRAQDECQEAVNSLSRALQDGDRISCLWKLLGDACLLISCSGSRTMSLNVPVKLLQDQTEEVVGRPQLLKISTMCFQKAVTLLPSCSGYWHDLGLSLFYRANRDADETSRRNLTTTATLSLKKATSLNPRNCEHWNALGVIAISPELKDYKLAQHCFIRAIQVESNNAVAWTNLGVLYLINGNEELAHRALSEAQSLEPSYANCWASLAIVAERVGHADTMDLFMHSTTLGNHVESLIGYGYWVCKTLHDVGNRGTDVFKYRIEEMAALPLSTDCLTRYTDKYVEDACAFNILGLLLEQQKLYKGASRAFRRALELLEADAAASVKESDMVRENLARTYTCTQLYADAAEQLAKIKEPGFFSQCSLATVLAKTNRLEDSYQAFESGVSWLANTDEEKSHALISMAALAYPLEGAESAKTLLFQSTQQSTVCPQALLSLGAIGLLAADIDLATAAVEELSRWANDRHFSRAIILLRIRLSVMKGEVEKVKSIVSKAIHVNPNCGDLWALLAFAMLTVTEEPNPSVIDCCRAVTEDLSLNAKVLEGVASLAAGNLRVALATAQRVLHCYPDNVESWCLMLGALYGNHIFGSDLKTLNSIVRYIQTKLTTGKEFDDLKWWTQCYRCIVRRQTRETQDANAAILEMGNFADDPKRISTREVLKCLVSSPRDEGKLLEMSEMATKFNKSFTVGWKVLVDSQLRDGNLENALDIVKQWQQQPNLKLQNLILPIIYEAFIYIKRAQADPKYLDSLSENTGKLHGWPQLKKSPVTHYLITVINMLIGNISKVKENGMRLILFPYRTEFQWMFSQTAKIVLTTLNSRDKNDVNLAHHIKRRAEECSLHEVKESYLHFIDNINSNEFDVGSN